jgi:AraC-like DNA-binding protein
MTLWGATVCAGLVRGDLEVARAVGLPVDDLMQRAGLSELDLGDPDARVPFDRYVDLWAALAATPGADRLVSRQADLLRLEALGVIGYVLTHSPTVGAAIAATVRFARLLGSEIVPRSEIADGRWTLARVLPARLAATRLFMEASAVGTLLLIERLCGVAPALEELAFQHPRHPQSQAVEALVRCPVLYDAPETVLAFRDDVAALPVQGHDPALLQILERHALALAERLPSDPPLSQRVSALVRDAFTQGEPAQAKIAKQLAMSERTLQRRLRDEGTSFADLVEAVRADLAKRYLRRPEMAVYEVAFLLGYSEPSAFYRAFRRWTGQTPQAYRGQGL